MSDAGPSSRIALAVLAAAEATGETTFIIIGSQAYYGTNSADHPPSVVESADVDMLPPKALPLEDFTRVHGEIGSESEFHDAQGFYVDMVQPDTPPMPLGWALRMTQMPVGEISIRGEKRPVIAAFPDIHDIVASKAVLNRPADFRFLADVARQGLLDRDTLRKRVASIKRVDREHRERALREIDQVFSRGRPRTGEDRRL
jgi:hypothetical protein